MFKPADLFDISQTEHAAIFDGCKFPWDALKKIEGYIAANLKPALHNPAMRDEGRAFIGEKVFIGEGTVVEDGAIYVPAPPEKEIVALIAYLQTLGHLTLATCQVAVYESETTMVVVEPDGNRALVPTGATQPSLNLASPDSTNLMITLILHEKHDEASNHGLLRHADVSIATAYRASDDILPE